jgi:glycosyltransferase involved in cell wall biosynthesis
MPRAAILVPGRLARTSGGNRYDRAVADALERDGWEVAILEPEDGPGPADLVILDSLAFPAGPPRTDAPVVALAHQIPGEVRTGRATLRERSALRCAVLVVTVADWLADRLRGLAPVPVEVVPPGRDSAWAAEGPDEDADTVLCVGNAVPGKGLPEAVEAFAAAAVEGATLVVAGDLGWDAAEAGRVQAAAEAAGPRVVVEGALSPEDLAGRYRRARLLLSASRYEGWPIAVAEAMASALPVVGYDIPGMQGLVRPGVDGLLVAAGDPAALGDATAELWKETGRARRMGAAARERALAWPTWDETGRRFAALAARVAGLTP